MTSGLERFRMDEERRGRVVYLRPSGDLDLVTEPQLRQRLDALRADRTPVVLDLTGVTFMDAQGLHLLEDAHAAARRERWRFKARRASPAVRRVLALCDGLNLVECAG